VMHTDLQLVIKLIINLLTTVNLFVCDFQLHRDVYIRVLFLFYLFDICQYYLIG